jgi:plastocyanin
MRRATTVAALVMVVAIVAAAAAYGLARTSGATPKGVDHTFVVPAGAGDRLDQGNALEILPRDLEVRVGDRLIVVNDDTRTHVVGPWTIRADSTFRFRFTRVGRYDSHCSLHQSGRFFIDVLPPV